MQRTGSYNHAFMSLYACFYLGMYSILWLKANKINFSVCQSDTNSHKKSVCEQIERVKSCNATLDCWMVVHTARTVLAVLQISHRHCHASHNRAERVCDLSSWYFLTKLLTKTENGAYVCDITKTAEETNFQNRRVCQESSALECCRWRSDHCHIL